LPQVKISKLELPINEDINSVYIAHQPEIFTHLLENRSNIFSFSNEKSIEKEKTTTNISEANINEYQQISTEPTNHKLPFLWKGSGVGQTTTELASSTKLNLLNCSNPYKLSYATQTANYYIQGGISKMLDSMKVTLVIEHLQTQQKSRNKIDLYEDKQVEKLSKEISEKLNLRKEQLNLPIY